MNLLRGVRDSVIIDDTYNSSPSAAIAALLTLYEIGDSATQRIAILGSMNELGAKSAEYHTQVGAQCDPLFLDWVVTIGEEAARYLAPAAKQNGCQVASFPGPIYAGTFAKKVLYDSLQTGAIILVKGSQNGVFAEEAVKLLLANADDANQLVRQSAEWMNKSDEYIQSLRPDVSDKE
jgi:UDP-N-acetylmuramoyl-tripeptide--D-alanyl-D-alanine ligase